MSLIRRLCKLAEIILIQYNVLDASVSSEKCNYFLKQTLHLMETRGALDMVKAVKTARNQIMRFSLGSPLSGPGLDPTGFPKWLSGLKDLTTSRKGLRALLTILTLTRAFALGRLPDLSTVTQEYNGEDSRKVIPDALLLKCLQKLGIRKGTVGDFTFPHVTTKKGPQGQALLTALSELTLLPSQLIADIKLLGGKSLGDHIDANLEPLDVLEAISPLCTPGVYFSISRWWDRVFPTKSKGFRKLSYFADKEDKVRVIAIFDYWSQSALRPLHTCVNRYLRRIGPDQTFNQSKFTTTLPPTLHENHYHSIDLSAATDRMPITLQKRVVKYLLGSSEKADAWERILVSYPFNTIIGKTPLKVSYGTGQPMGAYSSWSVMALTHHVLVQASALKAGVVLGRSNPNHLFKGYALLGDDLRIDHDLVAEEYKTMISSLDMPYSLEKTHTSKDGFEFAKRWFIGNEEITGFSIPGLLSVWKRYPLLINFLDNQKDHGWYLPEERHPDLILAIHKVFTKGSFIVNKTLSMIKLYKLFYYTRDFKVSPIVQVDKILEYLAPFLGDSLPPILISNQKRIIVNLMFLRAKRNIVEKDLCSFQREAFKVNSRLWSIVRQAIKEARVDQTVSDFLTETLSVILNWNNPIVMVLNRQIDESTDFLMKYWDPEQSDSFLFQEGLSKYHLTKGVFTMRASVGITLAESAILKAFISVAVNLKNESSEDYKALMERLKELNIQ